MFVGAILMMGLAIIGTYITETYQQVMQRPAFIIHEARLRGGPASNSTPE